MISGSHHACDFDYASLLIKLWCDTDRFRSKTWFRLRSITKGTQVGGR